MPERISDEKGVRLSVGQTRTLWQNGRKISLDFLYHTKDHLATFSEKNGWWRAAPQMASVGAKSPILNRYSLVAPQP